MKNLEQINNKKLTPIFIREETIKSCRKFFDTKNFHEVITPTLNKALPLEPNLFSFETKWNKIDQNYKLYLSTSPESGLKKMLAENIGNCYAIAKCFRNLENNGTRHNPEFLMLEWYRVNANYKDIMRDTKNLVFYIIKNINKKFGKNISLQKKWPVFSLEKLFKKYAKIDYKKIIDNDELFFAVAQNKGYNTQNSTWSQIYDQIFLNEIEPNLPNVPFFLVDFPARISPLCAVKKAKPYLAERFELYLSGMEIANGNTENIDYKYVETAFQKEQKNRQSENLPSHDYDEEFISALKKMSESKKTYAGIGLGIDRLAMFMADAKDISEVEFFVVNKPE